MTQLTMDLTYVGGPAIDMNALDISTSMDMEAYDGSADLMIASSLVIPADLLGVAPAAAVTFTAGTEYLNAYFRTFSSIEGPSQAMVVEANDSTVYDALTSAPAGKVFTATGTQFTSPLTFTLQAGFWGGIGGAGSVNRYFYIENMSSVDYVFPGNAIGTISYTP